MLYRKDVEKQEVGFPKEPKSESAYIPLKYNSFMETLFSKKMACYLCLATIHFAAYSQSAVGPPIMLGIFPF